MSSAQPRIVVVGSINMDLVIRCDSLPAAGQTIMAHSANEFFGGKGANQAVAAARSGASVKMIGKVGDDAFAERLLDNLRHHHVDCQHVSRQANCASGLAIISVDNQGQNSIAVVPGANAMLSAADIVAARELLVDCDLIMLQLEIPLETVLAVIEIAKANGVRVMLDPAPAPSHCPDELLDVDLLCPNELEAAELVGRPLETMDELKSATLELHRRGAKRVAVTLGAKGTLVYSDGEFSHVPAFAVDAIDTTAAGDAFAGTLAAYWVESADLKYAVRFANASGAIAASKKGAQASMGDRGEIESMVREIVRKTE